MNSHLGYVKGDMKECRKQAATVVASYTESEKMLMKKALRLSPK